MTVQVPLIEEKDGIRIRHKVMKSCTFVLRDKARPIPKRPERVYPTCGICGVPHSFRVYHFQLDAEGCVIVSTSIYQELLRFPDVGGFDLTDVIHDPPTQIIRVPRADTKVKPYRPGDVRRANAESET